MNENELSLDVIIGIINNSFSISNESLERSNFIIKSAEVTLKTIYDRTGGGELKLFVKAGKKWELEKASTITYKYERGRTDTRDKGVDDFQQNLSAIIINAANQVKGVQEKIRGLSKKSFTIELSFGITNTTSSGVTFDVWGIGVDSGIDFEKTVSHSVSLTFEEIT